MREEVGNDLMRKRVVRAVNVLSFVSEILDGDSREPLMVDALNAGDGVAAGMPDPAGRVMVVIALVACIQTGHVSVVGVLLVPLQRPRILATGAEDAGQRVPECLPEILLIRHENQFKSNQDLWPHYTSPERKLICESTLKYELSLKSVEFILKNKKKLVDFQQRPSSSAKSISKTIRQFARHFLPFCTRRMQYTL